MDILYPRVTMGEWTLLRKFPYILIGRIQNAQARKLPLGNSYLVHVFGVYFHDIFVKLYTAGAYLRPVNTTG